MAEDLKSVACNACGDDIETQSLINALLQNELLLSCNEEIFDESQFFKTDKNQLLDKLKEKFKTISKIINCTECEKCRLHAKQELLGIATALKVVFEIGNSNSQLNDLSRNELVALINTTAKFSDSIQN